MIRSISPTAIKRNYYARFPDGHFFDDGTMRFFESRLSQGYKCSDELIYFVTSERPWIQDWRQYFVRCMRRDGHIETCETADPFRSRAKALRHAKHLADCWDGFYLATSRTDHIEKGAAL